MNYTRSIIDILDEIVDAIPKAISIKEIEEEEDGSYTLSVDDIKWLQKGFYVTIDGEKYLINSVGECIINVTGEGAIEVNTFDAYPPVFTYGTPISVNEEISKDADKFNITPMIWLLMSYREIYDEDDESSIERESILRLFFLTQADFASWETSDFLENALKPMKRLQENFIAVVKASGDFETDELSVDVETRTKFGVYIGNKGYEKSLFADNLSGLETGMTLKIFKSANCLDC